MNENMDEILLGGQSFSWRKEEDGTFSSVLNERVYRIKGIEDAAKDPYLHDYFDMDYDYEKAKENIGKKDEILKNAVESVGTLRILRQEHFLTAFSFILSQNNNIKRITGLYDRISRRYGHEIEKDRFSFPSPDELKGANEEELRSLGVGFRAPFLLDLISNTSILDEVEEMEFPLAMETLQRIKGIGPKVASCILIFSYHRMEAFPIDVWMKRVMDKYYPGKDKGYFAPYEALSQQYLFSWIRKSGTTIP